MPILARLKGNADNLCSLSLYCCRCIVVLVFFVCTNDFSLYVHFLLRTFSRSLTWDFPTLGSNAGRVAIVDVTEELATLSEEAIWFCDSCQCKIYWHGVTFSHLVWLVKCNPK